MASLEYLREEMQRALEIMDDKSKPFDTRRAARARFWHCEKRVGAMERGGRTEDDPGHFMLGYSEVGFQPARETPPIAPSSEQQRRDLMDRRSEVQIEARRRL